MSRCCNHGGGCFLGRAEGKSSSLMVIFFLCLASTLGFYTGAILDREAPRVQVPFGEQHTEGKERARLAIRDLHQSKAYSDRRAPGVAGRLPIGPQIGIGEDTASSRWVSNMPFAADAAERMLFDYTEPVFYQPSLAPGFLLEEIQTKFHLKKAGGFLEFLLGGTDARGYVLRFSVDRVVALRENNEGERTLLREVSLLRPVEEVNTRIRLESERLRLTLAGQELEFFEGAAVGSGRFGIVASLAREDVRTLCLRGVLAGEAVFAECI